MSATHPRRRRRASAAADETIPRVPFSVFPSTYRNEDKTSETTEVQTEERVTVQGAEREGRRDKYTSQQGPARRDDRYAEEVRIEERDRYKPGGRVRRDEDIRITTGDDRYRDTRVDIERER